MAIVFLALNGEGLGHLSRTTIICRAIEETGERPIIFSQGMFPFDERSPLAGKKIPALWTANEALRREIAVDITTMAGISLPSVLVEDTHPNPIQLPPGFRRVLVVRPTIFGHISMLHNRYGRRFSAFLIADSPKSPTWPYSVAETSKLETWDNWHQVGPIYRSATVEEVEAVRARYGFVNSQRVCVFSMGGGGQDQGRDAERFLAFSASVAQEIRAHDRNARLILVKGPYCPAGLVIDGRFEVVEHETKMPALIAAVDGAVIRAGFNTTWECIAAATPFLPYVGSSFAEPIPERLEGLRSKGLLPDDSRAFWRDLRWRDKFRQTCHQITRQFPGKPAPQDIGRIIIGQRNYLESASRRVSVALWRAVRLSKKGAVQQAPGRPLFTIRIDDVVTLEPALDWLLLMLSQRGLRASLEVVPYLSSVNEDQIGQFDPSGHLFEISQHGYARVPRSNDQGYRYEFAPDSLAPTPEEVTAIGLGKVELMRAFPTRFAGGFSPPFDAMPNWLPPLWRRLGGRFVSRISTESIPGVEVPVVQAGVDTWDWANARPRDQSEITLQLERSAAMTGAAGIVVRPRGLRVGRERVRLAGLLDFVRKWRINTVWLSDIARRY